MDIAAYAVEAAIEADHWWYVGRRLLFSNIVKALGLPENADILDVGTSAGTNLRMLRDLGFVHVSGVDQSREAIRFCAEKGFGEVQLGNVCTLPFGDDRFDLILATDIIEHVEDDLAALCELDRVLRPGQHLLLTVPAFSLLWGLEDDVSHHKRRYRLPELLEKLRRANLIPVQHFYFNYLLFLPILATRFLMRIININVATEGELNTAWLKPRAHTDIPARRQDRRTVSAARGGFCSGRRDPKLSRLAGIDDIKLFAAAGDQPGPHVVTAYTVQLHQCIQTCFVEAVGLLTRARIGEFAGNKSKRKNPATRHVANGFGNQHLFFRRSDHAPNHVRGFRKEMI